MSVVWIAFPRTREVLVIDASGESRHARGARLPEHDELPGLAPEVDRLFAQLSS